MMIKNNISVYCILYIIFYHCLESQSWSRDLKVVAIIHSPECSKIYKISGSKPLLTPNSTLNKEYGRFIGLKLSIEIKSRFKGDFSKKKK